MRKKAEELLNYIRKDGSLCERDYMQSPWYENDEMTSKLESLLIEIINKESGGEVMKRKVYTAQEMRNMADCISNIKQSEMPSWKEGEVVTGGDLCRSAEMLRQAADMLESEETATKLIKELGDYIMKFGFNPEHIIDKMMDFYESKLRGDEKKEEK